MGDSFKGLVLDRGWAWAVLIGCCMAQSLFGMLYTVGMFNLIFLDVFGKDRQTTAWPSAVQVSLLSLAAPVSTMIYQRLGLRWTTIIGGVIGALGFFLTFFATTFVHLFITFGFLVGLGNGIAYLPCVLAIGLYFKKYRNLAFGLSFAAIGVATIVMPSVIDLTTELYGWRGGMLIMCGIQCHMVLIGALLRPQDLPQDLPQVTTDSDSERTPGGIYDSYQSLSVLGNLQNHQNNQGNTTTSLKSPPIKLHQSLQELNFSIQRKPLLQQLWSKSHNNLKYHNQLHSRSIHIDPQAFNESVHINPQAFSESVHINPPGFSESVRQSEGSDFSFIPKTTNDIHHLGSVHESDSGHDSPGTDGSQTSANLSLETKETAPSKWATLRNKDVVLLFINTLLVSAAVMLAYTHFPSYMLQQGAAPSDVKLVLTVIGVSNILCRILMGAALNSGDISALIVYLASGGLSSVFILFLPVLSQSVTGRLVFAVGFGFYGNVFNVLLVPVTLELFSLNELAMVHTVNLVGCGLGGLIGPPMAGWVYDMSGGYTTFIVAGVLHLIGSLSMILVPVGKSPPKETLIPETAA